MELKITDKKPQVKRIRLNGGSCVLLPFSFAVLRIPAEMNG